MNPNNLDVKEMRMQTLRSYLEQGYDHVVVIRANIAGTQKNTHESYLIVRYAEYMLRKEYPQMMFMRHDGDDGPWTACLINMDMKVLKQKLITLEDQDSIGRLCDLDVYDKHLEPLSRVSLGYPMRPCFLCNHDAHACVRTKRHSLIDIKDFITHTIKHYLTLQLHTFIKDSMMKELNLEEKFGLVTPSKSGSHHDMNYELMVNTHSVIIPYLIDIFFVGFQAKERYLLLTDARQIGIKAEWAMFEKTNGVNCYKGLIFILGLVLVSLGYTLYHKQTFEHIFHNIQLMSKPLLDDFMDKPMSFGEHAYQEHRIMGARGEAFLGLPTVHHALSSLDKKDLTDTDLRKTLQLIIRSTDDTVLLKRAGSFERYIDIKKRVENINMDNMDDVKAFTSWAIEERISFGGSADLLIATIFLHDIKSLFF